MMAAWNNDRELSFLYGCGNQLCVCGELAFSQYVNKKSVFKNIFMFLY